METFGGVNRWEAFGDQRAPPFGNSFKKTVKPDYWSKSNLAKRMVSPARPWVAERSSVENPNIWRNAARAEIVLCPPRSTMFSTLAPLDPSSPTTSPTKASGTYPISLHDRFSKAGLAAANAF